MSSTRREFMKATGWCALGAAAGTSGVTQNADAAPAKTAPVKTSPTVIAVYLRGGADALSAIVPFTDRDYAKVRPSLALSGPDSKSARSVLPLDANFGFNPNMKELHALYEKGMCAPITCVGSPHDTRSHFDAQDFMERGAPGQKFISTGWLNRYLQHTRTSKDANLRAVSLQSLLPRSLRGDYPVLAKPDQNAELAMNLYYRLYPQKKFKPGEKPPSENLGQRTRKEIEEFGAKTIEQLFELTSVLETAPASTARYPTSGFARQMRDLAKLIKADRGFEVSAIDYGGWDHHINEGPVAGAMGRMLGDVSATLGAFVEDIGPLRAQTTLVLVMSEFGRTVHENGNQGTDHGHGGFMLAVGGKVSGHRVFGRWTGLSEDKLYEKRDLPVHTDFRVVFAETLKGMFGFDGIKLKLFPEYSADSPPLGFLGVA